MRPRSSLVFILLFSSVISAMENKEIIHPIEIPIFSKLTAYALVDICKDTPQELLSSLLNLSLINKTVRKSVFPLFNERNKDTGDLSKESELFNNYAMSILTKHFETQAKFSPHCVAAAYIGTRYALSILQKAYEPSTTLKIFQSKLDPRFIPIKSRTVGGLLPVVIRVMNEPEPFEDTLKKFPPSTRNFCKKLIQEKPKNNS